MAELVRPFSIDIEEDFLADTQPIRTRTVRPRSLRQAASNNLSLQKFIRELAPDIQTAVYAWRDILKLSLDIALAAVVLSVILLLLAPLLFNDQLLIVLSQSMEPTIKIGDIVLSRPTAPEDIQIGNVITFRVPSAGSTNLVTHRVIEILENGTQRQFRTQGDAVDTPDTRPVSALDVVGRMWLIVPKAGYLIHSIRTPLGYLLLIGIPALWLIFGEIKNIYRTLLHPG